MSFLSKIFKAKERKPIIVVSGLPRSGTSMMMQILVAGGIEPITDNQRQPDENNSKGYYEYNDVKALANHNYSCIDNAQGKAIKVVSTLLKYLPEDRRYKVIFMQRNINEVLASQAAMLKKLGHAETTTAEDEKLRAKYLKHLDQTTKWLNNCSNMDALFVSYSEALCSPDTTVDKIGKFLSADLNRNAMQISIDKNMQHQRLL